MLLSISLFLRKVFRTLVFKTSSNSVNFHHSPGPPPSSMRLPSSGARFYALATPTSTLWLSRNTPAVVRWPSSHETRHLSTLKSQSTSSPHGAATRDVKFAANYTLAFSFGILLGVTTVGVVNAEAKQNVFLGEGCDRATSRPVTGVDSDQKEQVARWRRNLGVYVWGSNAFRIAAPATADSSVNVPKQLSSLKGRVFRSLVLGRTHAACIDENGDLYQWGVGFMGEHDAGEPAQSLVGCDLVRVAVSEDKVYTLARNGSLYVIPAARQLQSEAGGQSAVKPTWRQWMANWGKNPGQGIAGAELKIPEAEKIKGEVIVEIAAGAHHLCALTSQGRVFTALADLKGNEYGQSGIDSIRNFGTAAPGTTNYSTELNLVSGMENVTVVQIACGQNHSVVRSKDGRAFVFGRNNAGQLALNVTAATKTVSRPTQISSRWPNGQSNSGDYVALVAAGGNNSYFLIGHDEPNGTSPARFDVFSVGYGKDGQLGTGHYTTLQDGPTRLRALSGLTEYKESEKGIEPIGVKDIKVGATHAAAVLDNAREEKIEGQDDVVYGSDVFIWGSNSEAQCENSGRPHLAVPSHLPLLQHSGSQIELARDKKDLETVESHISKAGRLQLSPAAYVVNHEGKTVGPVEQTLELGNGTTAVYGKIKSEVRV